MNVILELNDELNEDIKCTNPIHEFPCVHTINISVTWEYKIIEHIRTTCTPNK